MKNMHIEPQTMTHMKIWNIYYVNNFFQFIFLFLCVCVISLVVVVFFFFKSFDVIWRLLKVFWVQTSQAIHVKLLCHQNIYPLSLSLSPPSPGFSTKFLNRIIGSSICIWMLCCIFNRSFEVQLKCSIKMDEKAHNCGK